MVTQVMYNDISLGANPGYVDPASLTITTVPEPGSLALLGLGAGALFLRRRRR